MTTNRSNSLHLQPGCLSVSNSIYQTTADLHRESIEFGSQYVAEKTAQKTFVSSHHTLTRNQGKKEVEVEVTKYPATTKLTDSTLTLDLTQKILSLALVLFFCMILFLYFFNICKLNTVLWLRIKNRN
jgi:hypothetical protein